MHVLTSLDLRGWEGAHSEPENFFCILLMILDVKRPPFQLYLYERVFERRKKRSRRPTERQR